MHGHGEVMMVFVYWLPKCVARLPFLHHWPLIQSMSPMKVNVGKLDLACLIRRCFMAIDISGIAGILVCCTCPPLHTRFFQRVFIGYNGLHCPIVSIGS